MPKGARCVECGFLARRDKQSKTTVPGWWEVYPERRIDPLLAIWIAADSFRSTPYAADLVCFRYSEAFPERELTHAAIMRDQSGASSRVELKALRECREFCDYMPGHDPKDHMAERRIGLLERSQRRLQHAAIWIAAIFGAAQVTVAVLDYMKPSPPPAVIVVPARPPLLLG